jgi:hypothetical protein
MNVFLDNFGKTYSRRPGKRRTSSPRRVDIDTVSLAFRLGELGAAEAAMVRRLFRRMEERPETGFGVISALTRYAQVRIMLRAGMDSEVPATDIPLTSPSITRAAAPPSA